MTVTNLPAHLVDIEVFDEMREALEEDFADLIQTFLEDAPQLLDDIASGLGSGSVETVQMAAHSLKSTSASLGFVGLSVDAETLEKIARGGQLDGGLKLLDQLQISFGELKGYLQPI